MRDRIVAAIARFEAMHGLRLAIDATERRALAALIHADVVQDMPYSAHMPRAQIVPRQDGGEQWEWHQDRYDIEIEVLDGKIVSAFAERIPPDATIEEHQHEAVAAVAGAIRRVLTPELLQKLINQLQQPDKGFR